MTITLCFKKRHKVMGHHIKLETYFAGLLQKVEWQIQEYEDTAMDTLTPVSYTHLTLPTICSV